MIRQSPDVWHMAGAFAPLHATLAIPSHMEFPEISQGPLMDLTQTSHGSHIPARTRLFANPLFAKCAAEFHESFFGNDRASTVTPRFRALGPANTTIPEGASSSGQCAMPGLRREWPRAPPAPRANRFPMRRGKTRRRLPEADRSPAAADRRG